MKNQVGENQVIEPKINGIDESGVSKKYDLVLNLTEGDRGAIASFFSKAPIKVGMNNNKGFLLKKYCYSHLVKAHASKHEVEKNLDFLRIIGIYPKEEDKKLLFYIPPYIKNK